MHTLLKQRRVVDAVLTNVVLGYNLDQQFSGHHLFPDVSVNALAGKIVKFGKDAFIIVDSKTAPGATIRGVGLQYSSDVYELNIRKLAAMATIEEIESADKLKAVKFKSRAVAQVMQRMRLEGENDMAKLATNPANYLTNHKTALSGTSQWSNPAANIDTQISDAKATIRAKIGREPNVLHLDYNGYLAMRKNETIRTGILGTTGKGTITAQMLADHFEVDKVIVGKSLYLKDDDADFEDIWKGSSILAYIPEKAHQDKVEPSFGYNYVEENYPYVGKEYFNESTDTWNNKVYFRDKAIITYPEAGFLFSNTVA